MLAVCLLGSVIPVVIGIDNYSRVITDPNIRGPFISVFIWTIVFAFLSVVLTFGVGLGIALVLNDPKLPFRAFFRELAAVIPPFTLWQLGWYGGRKPFVVNLAAAVGLAGLAWALTQALGTPAQ